MSKEINGVIPVMLTPFDDENRVDFAGLRNLTDWYIANGSDALFAVCQSSEMQFLTLEERVAIGKLVVGHTGGRVPVLVSGHIAETKDEQVRELSAMASLGADVVVLVTNRLDPFQQGGSILRDSIEHLLAELPPETVFGLYECPAPYRRLLTDEELKFCADTGRFVVLKDVSCDLDTLKRRQTIVAGSALKVINANAALAYDAMKIGLSGFCGVMTNYHPDLYKWLLGTASAPSERSEEVAAILSLAAMSEAYGYPALAKRFHQRRGTFNSIKCRVTPGDLHERIWAADPLLVHIDRAGEYLRKISTEASV